MAVGRMLRREVSVDRRVKRLASDSHRMLFLLTVPHLDRDGRITAEPDEYLAIVAPILRHLDDEHAEAAMADFDAVDLADLYTDERGKRVLSFPRFADSQPGMRYDREAPSKYGPPPTPDNSGGGPDNSGPAPPGERSGVEPELSGVAPDNSGVGPESAKHPESHNSGVGPELSGVKPEDSRLKEVKGKERTSRARAREALDPTEVHGWFAEAWRKHKPRQALPPQRAWHTVWERIAAVVEEQAGLEGADPEAVARRLFEAAFADEFVAGTTGVKPGAILSEASRLLAESEQSPPSAPEDIAQHNRAILESLG